MKLLTFKAQRKSLIRLGSGLSCIIMGIALLYECYLVFNNIDHNHLTPFWLVL